MKKNNLYRVLGILFSALIIVGMFLPYIKESASSLFKLYKDNNQLVLPTVLLLFGVISLILYILNRYIEFALSTAGAVLFYMITETISLINEDALNQVGIGFILIGAGGILLIINTFLAIIAAKKELKESSSEEPSSQYQQPRDMIQALENTNNTYEPVQPVVEQPMVQPVIEQPMVQPIVEQPMVQPVVEQPMVQPVVEQPMVQPVVEQPMVQPVIEQPMVQPVVEQPMVQPVIEQPMVQPVIEQPVVQPINELKPIEDVTSQGLKPIEEQVVPTTSQFNPLPDIQFEPINEPVQEIKPINPEPVEAPLNPVLQQFEIPTSFLNSGAPVKHDEPQAINTSNTQPSVGMDIFNNH